MRTLGESARASERIDYSVWRDTMHAFAADRAFA
jgi:hypothetical protein